MAGPAKLYFDVWDAATPKGTALGELTQAYGKAVHDVRNGAGSGEFTINRHDSQAAWCADWNLVRVRIVPGGPFAWDSTNYKFAFYIEDKTDELLSADEQAGDEWKRGGRMILSVLERCVWWNESFATEDGSTPLIHDDEWIFPDGDEFGHVLQRLVNEWNARPSPGPNPDTISKNFTQTTDSSGAAWETFAGDYSIGIGDDYLSSIADLISQGIEVHMRPDFQLRAWNEDGRGTDRTASVVFRAGWNIREGGSREGHGRFRGTRALVRGKSTTAPVYVEATAPYTASEESGRMGRREIYVEYEKTTHTAPLLRAGKRALWRSRRRNDGPPTFGVTSYPRGTGSQSDGGSPPAVRDLLPWTDYFVGDLVTLDVPGEYSNVQVRLSEITVYDGDNGEADVAITLDDSPFHPAGGGSDSGISGTGGGGTGKCCRHSHTPNFPPEPTPDVAGTTIAFWDFEDHGFGDRTFDTTGTYKLQLAVQIANGNQYLCPGGAAYCGYNTASHRTSVSIPIAADTDHVLELDLKIHNDSALRGDVWVKYDGASGTPTADELLIDGGDYAPNVAYHVAKAFHTPPGVSTVKLWFTPYSGNFVDNVLLATAGTITPDDPYAIPGGGGSSPYVPHSDDPRFTAPDQHPTSRTSLSMTNGSGGDLEAGTVVVATDAGTFDTVPTASYADGMLGILLEDIADGEAGLVLWSGIGAYAVTTSAAAAPGDFLFASATPGEADVDATRAAGAVGKVIAVDDADAPTFVEWWGIPDGSSGGGSSGHTITEDGGAGFTARAKLDFRHGLDVTDDAGSSSTRVAVDESELTHNSLGGLTTGDPHTQYALDSDLAGYVPNSIFAAKGDLLGASANDTPSLVAAGSEGQIPVQRAAATPGVAFEAQYAALTMTIGNGVVVIPTGVKGFVRVPFACEIVRASLMADVSGSIVIDVWKDSWANFPPAVADTITASAKPTLSSAQKAEDTTLTGWTKTLAEGDVLGINVDSATTVKQVTLELRVKRT